jgi:hypothetical protein
MPSPVPFPLLPRTPIWRSLICAGALLLPVTLRLHGQALRAEPIVFGNGRVTVSGDISGSFSCAYGDGLHGCAADEGFFNYSNYENNLLRTFRVNLAAAVKASDRVSVLTEVRSDNLQRPQPYALYVRFRPWTTRRFDIQAGRIPPSFGAFSRRPYPTDNLLIGYPLAYQYLTSLRPDAIPASTDELLRMRGRGWLTNYSIGDPTPDVGLPLVNGLVWDTGVQGHLATDAIDIAGSVTVGALASPRVRDNNPGKQASGRVGIHPIAGLIVGASAAHGQVGSRFLLLGGTAAPGDHDALTQTAWGADLEYSRGYYLIRAETIVSTFRLPAASPSLAGPLRAIATTVEGRYKLRPGLYAAARFDRLTLNTIANATGPATWEAPVWRVESGIGYSLERNLLLKVVYQHNDRDGGRVPVLSLVAAQLVYWF